VKRVVTGWTEAGEPTILFEGEPPATFDFGVAGSAEVWSTKAVPAESRQTTDPTAAGFTVEPPIGGTVCRVATYRPGAAIDVHSTETVDYIIVISGELTMIFGDREILLGAGDVVVQQATPHGWANRSDEPCVVAAILLTAEGASDDGRMQWP
jgi:quercetin dioxygenase-like cupin family protein